MSLPPDSGWQPTPASSPVRNSGQSVAVMVLGIVGLTLFCAYGVGVIPAIVALALAPGARKQIEVSQGTLGGLSFIRAGVVCAWVAIGLLLTALAIGGVVWLVSSSA